MSYPVLTLLPLLLQRLLLLLLLGLILSVGWLLPGLLSAMLPCLLCWLRLLGLPLQCLLPSIFLMSSFLPLKVLVWDLWWLQALWYKILMIVFIPFCTFSTAGSGYPRGGVGCSLSSALRRALIFVEGSQ